MSDDELITKLEACTLPPDQFHHAEHLQAAWVYLTRFPTLDAMARCSRALQNFAASVGKPERYHETMTWAYLLLLNERIRASAAKGTWAEFAAAHPDLLNWQDSIVNTYYSPETLRSERARLTFVMPDRLETAGPPR